MNKVEKKVADFHNKVIDNIPKDIQEKILLVQEKAGFVPNIFLLLANRPEEFRAFFSYHDAIMLKDTGNLTKADREMIVVATSSKNNCLYCVVAHGALLRIFTKISNISDQIAINYQKAEISPRKKAILDFAIKVCEDSSSINEVDYLSLYKQGFDENDVWDITSISAFFAMSNRLSNAIGLQPNKEFYSLGR